MKFFHSIDHEILFQKLKELDFSMDELWFLEQIISKDSKKGLPLRNISSQWFALLYLNSVDHYVKEVLQIKGYIRYMDDIILIHRDKMYLRQCPSKIEEICLKKLNLSLNKKTQIGKVSDGIDFLGYSHSITKTGKVIVRLRKSWKIRMKRHLKTLKN